MTPGPDLAATVVRLEVERDEARDEVGNFATFICALATAMDKAGFPAPRQHAITTGMIESLVAERDDARANAEQLRDLIAEAGTIIAEYAPGHTVWLRAASIATTNNTKETP